MTASVHSLDMFIDSNSNNRSEEYTRLPGVPYRVSSISPMLMWILYFSEKPESESETERVSSLYLEDKTITNLDCSSFSV
jgi:hypothetical protein